MPRWVLASGRGGAQRLLRFVVRIGLALLFCHLHDRACFQGCGAEFVPAASAAQAAVAGLRLNVPRLHNQGRDLVIHVGHASSNATCELMFSTNLGSAADWTVLQRGLPGQTNFVVALPKARSGFFSLRVPLLTGPATFSVLEDMPVALSQFAVDGLSGSTAQLMLWATNGLLQLPSTNPAAPSTNAWAPSVVITAPADLLDSTLHGIRYQGKPDYFGPDVLSLLLTHVGPVSGARELIEARVAVLPVNDAPRASADAFRALEDSTLYVPAPGVLANDTDLEREPLSAVLALHPAHGTLNLNDDGSFTYLPRPDFAGIDRFQYAASDGARLSTPVTASISVEPGIDAPVVTMLAPANGASIAVGVDLELQAEAIDTDGWVTSVEYLSGTLLLGTASRPPFTVRWQQSTPGQYSVHARATDDTGAVGLSRPISVIVSPDCDSDGVSDAVELRDGRDPCDFFDGLKPTLVLLGGGFQSGSPDVVLPDPLVVKVMSASGAASSNTAVTFVITEGGGQLSSSSAGPWTNSLALVTGPGGLASAWFWLPAAPDQLSVGKVIAGHGSNLVEVTFAGAAVALRDRWVLENKPISVSAGGYHSLALLEDGTVLAWGWNAMGQLGDQVDRHSVPYSAVPMPVPGISNVRAVAAGAWHSLALLYDGSVLAWGEYWEGYPVVVPPGLSTVRAIAAGQGHSLALMADGTVRAWGDPFENFAPPPSLAGVSAISAGFGFSLALTTNGTVIAWGLSAFDPPYGQTNVPAGLTYVTAIAAGSYHCLALRSNGTVVAWGLNADGQATVPAGLGSVVAIQAGLSQSLALLADGTVIRWGRDGSGQSGALAASGAALAFDAGGVLSSSHSLLLRPDGTVWAWGDNAYGQLGNGSMTDGVAPTPVTGLPPLSTTTHVAFEVYTPLK